MWFFLFYDFIWWEIILIFLGILYIIFHSSHSVMAQLNKFREFKHFKQSERIRIKRRHSVEQKKIDIQTRRTDISLNNVFVKLSAKDKLTLQNIFKSVQAKLVVHEYDEARIEIIRGLVIDRHNEWLNVLLAQLYEMEGDFSKAEILYRDIILQFEPIKAEIFIYLWNNLVHQNNKKLAYEIYKKWLEKEPKNIQLLLTLAELWYELHEYDEALYYSKRLSDVQPKSIRAFEILWLSHLQVGSDQKAYETFLTLRKIDPYNEIVHVWLSKIESKLWVHPSVKTFNER